MFKYLIIVVFFIGTTTYAQKDQEEKRTTLTEITASPNPFSETTYISFESIASQEVVFVVKNVLHNTVYQELYYAKKGINKIRFSRKTLKPGMYFYILKTGDEVVTKRLVIK
jgi:hypothetical protein